MAAQTTPPCIGLLCGSGQLPLRVARSLLDRGMRVVAVAIKGEADPAIDELVPDVEWTGVAKLGRWVKVFSRARVEALLMVGGIEKPRMYDGPARLMPDVRSAKLLYRSLRSKEDHTILGAVAAEFEKDGIHVGSIVDYCPEMLVAPGPLTPRAPTTAQWEDIRFAWPLAKRIAEMQIGQCIVVKDCAVVAVEGIDGTDATLERGGRLAKGDAVAVKVPRKGHDVRFDIPCTGPSTVETLARAGVAVLAVEARGTIVIDPDAVRARAEEAGVCIIAVTPEDVGDPGPPEPPDGASGSSGSD